MMKWSTPRRRREDLSANDHEPLRMPLAPLFEKIAYVAPSIHRPSLNLSTLAIALALIDTEFEARH